MTYRLSLLDKSPIPAGATAAQALQRSVSVAQKAEALGYHRYWVAEHHGNPEYASTAPEILVAHILAKTTRIRVGSGGVLLQHYSPFKVAETFKVLSALAPGRVDLGIGKAPGGLPLQTRALQSRFDKTSAPAFADLLADLDGFLANDLPIDHPLSGAVAHPHSHHVPTRFLLGGSVDSAVLAAQRGWEFVYAGHFNGDPQNIERSLSAFRQASGREPLLALYAFAAASDSEAERQVGTLRVFKVHLPTGQTFNLPSRTAAIEFARQTGVTEYRLEETRPQVVAGTPERVRDELEALSARYGIREFVLDTPVPGFAQRLASIELLAGAQHTAHA